MDERTAPNPSTHLLPVGSVVATVEEGPEAGLRAERPERVTIGTAEGNDVVLSDPTVSRWHLEVVASDRGLLVRDLESTNGTWVGTVRLDRAVVRPGTTLRVGDCRVRVEEGAIERVELHPDGELAGIVGRSVPMRRLMARLRRASAAEAPVLLLGESGTGKELLARALHQLGSRRRGPFVTVDCASLAPTLVASELFGHERGAFTGAERRHQGAFERADGGTIFLDEVGELSPELQAALLGVLERRRLRRVGGREEIPVDVRVVAATNRDLRADVNRGRFRLDLYHRLAVLVIRVPPLRERPEDVPPLIDHFLARLGVPGTHRELFTPRELSALQGHHWPGNVRELRNVVEATVAWGEPVLPDAATDAGRSGNEPEAEASEQDPGALPPYREARTRALLRFERDYLGRLVERAGGNLSEAARLARMDRAYLRQLLRRHGLRR